jgi:hypothetical protein
LYIHKLNKKNKHKKTPPKGEVNLKIRQQHTFPGFTPVSSAQLSLTSLFGMGRGGHQRYNHQKYHISS